MNDRASTAFCVKTERARSHAGNSSSAWVSEEDTRDTAAGRNSPRPEARTLIVATGPRGVIGRRVGTGSGTRRDRVAEFIRDVDHMVVATALGRPGGGVKFVAADRRVDAHAIVGNDEVLAVELPVHDEGGRGRGRPRCAARAVRGPAAREGVVHRRGVRRHGVGIGELGGTTGHGEALRGAAADRRDVDRHRRGVGQRTVVRAVGDRDDLVAAGHAEAR